MALANYTELKAAVTRAIKRSDMATDIDDWLVLCEKELNTLLHRREMSQRATTSTVANQQAYALPADFGDAIDLHLISGGVDTVLTPSDWTRIETDWPSTGEPRDWSITANQFVLGPTPDAVYTLELYYYKGIPPLATNTTNWVLTNYPKVVFYGTLVNAAATTDDPQGAAWAAMYRESLKTLIRDQIRERGFGGGPLLRTEFGGRGSNILTGE